MKNQKKQRSDFLIYSRTANISSKVSRKTRFSRLSMIIAAALLSMPTLVANPAYAQTETKVEFDGSKARVNLTGRLRMLTQRMAAASCRVSAGYDIDAAKKELTESQVEFTEILNGLKNGDNKIGVPNPERFSRLKRGLGALEKVWLVKSAAIDNIVAGIDVASNIQVIGESTDKQAVITSNLASEFIAQYTNPAELLAGDAFTINIAGRQGELSQQISKEICGVYSQQPVFGTVDSLLATKKLFSGSLVALENGMPSAGVIKPPNDLIKSQLAESRIIWEAEDKNLREHEDLSEPRSVTVEEAAHNTSLMIGMNNLVTLYMLATPGQDDVYKIPLQAYAYNELSQWIKNPDLVAAIKAQNAAHSNLSQDAIDGLDKQWRAEAKSDGAKPLIDKLMGLQTSKWLAEKQTRSAGLVTEVFAMDNKGLNVAQSAVTSDYWQGDEAKWKETFGNNSGAIHISEVEFDDSTGSYQSQVSMPVRDLETGAMIGAITFGVNVQSFL